MTIRASASSRSIAGSLSAAGASFAPYNGNTTAQVAVGPGGGQVTVSNSNFFINSLSLGNSLNDTLSSDVFGSPGHPSGFSVTSGAIVNITNNDFTNIGANGLVASGDATAHLDLKLNYWCISDATAIGAKILDHTDSGKSTRPYVDFTPFVSNSSGILANSVTVAYSASDQNVTLTASVASSSARVGVTVNDGTVTFSIFNGSMMCPSPWRRARIRSRPSTPDRADS